MHELSICQALITQVEQIAKAHHAANVINIRVLIGPLSGVEIPLLARAYPLVAAGSIAEQAKLELEPMPIRLRCNNCLTETEASPSHLLCGECGSLHTELISGDEMLLASIECDKAPG